MKIHQITDVVCVLRIGAYDMGLGNTELEAHDTRVFVMISANFRPVELSEILGKYTVPQRKIIQSRNALDTSIKKALEGSEYLDVCKVTYEAHFEKFSVGVAEKLFEISLACEFTIYNDGFHNELVHQQMEDVLTAYIDSADVPWNSDRNRQMSISEKFTRKCCPAQQEEMRKINCSSHRLLEKLRQRERASTHDNIHALGWTNWSTFSSLRQLSVEFDGDHIREARVGDGGLNDMFGITPCDYFYMQKSPPYSIAQRRKRLSLMHESLELQSEKILQMKELEERLKMQQSIGTREFSEMIILLRKTKKLRRQAEAKLQEIQEKIALFQEPRGILHRQ